MSTLRAENIKVRYPEFTLDLSFNIPSGEFVSIIGPSGSGKSTVLTAIAGLTAVDDGCFILGDRNITKEAVQKRNISLVFQDYALFTNMDAGKNVEYPLKIRKMKAKERAERKKNLLSFVGLEGFDKRKISTLSGGQAQRVALARALAADPELLLLDEPLSALDAAMRRRLKEEIRRIHDESNLTTLYVTHDREEAFSISDRIIVMRDGHIEMTGTPEEVYRKPKTLFTATFTGDGTKLPASFFNSSIEADTIFFRPEAVQVKDGIFYGDEMTYIKLEGAEIISSEFLGSHYLLGLIYNGHRVLAEVSQKPSKSIVDAYIRKSELLFYKDDNLLL